MTDHTVLGQVALGYSPMIDRHKAITALRLTVFPVRADSLPDVHALLAALAEAWPDPAHRVSLNIVGETLLDAVLRTDLPLNMMLEVPAFMASDLACTDALAALHTRGNTLLIKGRPLQPLPRTVLPCFAYSIIDLADERRDGMPPPGGVSRNIPHVQAGVQTGAEMTEAFGRGAIAVLGWPIDDPLAARPASSRGAQPELSAIVELINRVDRQESVDRLEAVMKNDPTMAFRLMRYINSPAFGLAVEVTSFRHAIMLLGHQRLKRWLALLLAAGSRDPGMKPVIYAAVRRGLLMEELGRDSGCDDERRGELFICGVFSLLDRLMQQPFADLLRSIPTTEAVRAALVDGSGPHQPYLALVQAVEAASLLDMRDATAALMMTPQAVNQAVLRALVAARQLD
ncbi:MAG TPA: HDOD domain-containing protein [Aquabacterium sp.]|nr:HDOD domain-containing protein [Aquabacterium sp.]HQC98544.1 HDOD domain-containing protein [Aquabacterium sp.]